MNPRYPKLYIILGFILLSLITSLGAYGIYQATHSQSSTISDNNTPTQPETVGTNPALPVETGFTLLLDQGVTQQDLVTFQSGISNFFVSNTTTYKPSSVVVLSGAQCTPPNDAGYIICTYTLTVNDTSILHGTLKTDTTGPISITLSDSNSKEVLNKTLDATN